MRRFFIVFLLIALIIPVNAKAYEVPPVSAEAAEMMDADMPSFAEGLWHVIKTAFSKMEPDLASSIRLCMAAVGISMLISVLASIPGKSMECVNLAGLVGVCVLLLRSSDILIHSASDTITQISSYAQLLLPVITASSAAQGNITSSAALYTGTAFFDAILSKLISTALLPLVYIFLVLMIAECAVRVDSLQRLRELCKWLITWLLKTVLYIFTGYMSLTGVISGAADKTAIKAAKLTISGAVPIVGGILSDASETILVGAGVVKNSIGVYGLIALVATVILPFLRIAIMYLCLKLSSALCSLFTGNQISQLLQGFSDAMGMLLGMTGAVCLMFMISIVCFMKGVVI